jgi:hypothetical protein
MSELFSMFTEKSVSFDGVGGGEPTLTPEMVAAACTGMRRPVYLYGLVKFALDRSVFHDLVWLNRLDVIRRAEALQWTAGKGCDSNFEQLRIGALADAALAYSLSDVHCKHCRGTGVQKNHKPCRPCNGDGKPSRATPGERRMATALNITRHEWRNVWVPRFSAKVDEYAVWEGEIDKAVRKQVFDEKK